MIEFAQIRIGLFLAEGQPSVAVYVLKVAFGALRDPMAHAGGWRGLRE